MTRSTAGGRGDGVRGCSSEGVRGCSSEGVRGCSSEGVRGCSSEGVRGCSSEGVRGCSSEGVRGCSSEGVRGCREGIERVLWSESRSVDERALCRLKEVWLAASGDQVVRDRGGRGGPPRAQSALSGCGLQCILRYSGGRGRERGQLSCKYTHTPLTHDTTHQRWSDSLALTL